MGSAWIKTNFAGVRYREHPTRKHGLKKDRYFTIRYKLDGKDKEEALGWASEGWSETKAFAERNRLKEAKRKGEGDITLADSRRTAAEKKAKEDKKREEDAKFNITLNSFHEKFFEPYFKGNVKNHTFASEKAIYTKWIQDEIGDLSLKNITSLDIEKIKNQMTTKGRAPKTINNMVASLRQIFNYAKKIGYYSGNSPTEHIKQIKHDNQRSRFLSHKEAETLLEALRTKYPQTYEMALISLHCGLRAGEIFNLKWTDIDAKKGFITVRDPKSSKNRVAYMTEEIKLLFKSKKYESKDQYVFLSTKGTKITSISNSFEDVVKELKLNDGHTDRRQKIVFHSLRHTYASWLVESGVSLYIVQKLMGHSHINMTERYSHLSNDTMQDAVRSLEQGIAKEKNAKRKKNANNK